MRPFLLLTSLLLCLSAFCAQAQDSVTVNQPDSILVSRVDSALKKKFQPDAKRAGLYSALIPGLGQCYNRQYWKMPIVYAMMGTTIYMVVHNNNEFRRYRRAYVSRLSDGANSKDEFQGILQPTAIKAYQDQARQNMDMMIALTVVGYAGQILEAISGAHLRNFDISKDLTMQLRPAILPANTIGIGLAVNFKR